MEVHLQEGFDSEPVVLRINGRTVFEEDVVTTNLMLGVATTFEVDLAGAPGPLEVEVVLPARDVDERISLLRPPPQLGLSVQGGRVVARVADEPFGYL